MELPLTYATKFHQTQPGEPRSTREELLRDFKDRLNSDRAEVRLPALTDGRIVRMFKGYPTEGLYKLFKECEGAKKFGGLLKFKLAEFKNAKV